MPTLVQRRANIGIRKISVPQATELNRILLSPVGSSYGSRGKRKVVFWVSVPYVADMVVSLSSNVKFNVSNP